MKKIYLLLVLFCVFAQVSAQNNTSGAVIASEFHVTKPLREIFAANPVDENKVYPEKESRDREHRIPAKFLKTVADGPQYSNAPVSLQKTMGDVTASQTRVAWPGQTASGFRPFDPSGAVGPNHYVQMINSTTFKVYNKTGSVLLTATLGNLWSPATANAGDPIVMYDKAADRWFLAQFGSSTDKKIYIAVSTSSDPTGSYYTYTYVSPLFPDYLKFCVWQDGYYMTSNQSTQRVFAFERAAMLAGTPGAKSVYVNYTPPKSGFFVPLPGDAADGNLPPAGTPCPIFSYSDNGWGAAYTDAVNIYKMSVNWTPATPTATITLANNVATAAFDASYNASWNDCPQPGTTQKLDGIGGVCMYRAQWKSWSGYNSVVLNWAVKISTTQRSIKWCELRQNQSTGVWTMYQEGIYTPDANTRWLGSIAMDNNGSIGLSYIKSNSTSIYPGIYYTGRRSCDPLGTLPVTETVVVAGTGSQTGVNRVGDYSQTTLDPDGVTFWGTSEYMGGATGSSAARTHIFSYQITPCTTTTVAGVSIALTAGTNPTCTGSSLTFTATPTNGGSAPSYQWKVDGVNAGTNAATFTTSSLTNGQVVSCVMTSNLAGVTGNPATSNTVAVTVNGAVAPSVSIALTTGTNPSCSGAAKTFTATATNGGTTPAYQWKVNGVNAGTNSATFSTSTLAANDVVSCVLTSNLACASTPTATSNSITISFNAAVTPAVTIAITSGTNPSASGASVTFTATPTNGGTTPSYQWKVGTANVGTNAATYTTTTLTNGQVVSCVMTSNASCVTSTTATSNSITMTITGGAPTYCAASTTNTTFEYISKVVMGTINNTTSRSSYTNYSALSTNVLTGTAYPVTVTIGGAYSTDKVLIWCDWNNNGVFTDAGEAVFVSAAGVGPFTANITPPSTAFVGTVRMRIRLTDGGAGPNLTPCGSSTYGEVEDYSLNVAFGKATEAITAAPAVTSSALPTLELQVYPNPSNGMFTVRSNFSGTYYIMNTAGELVKTISLSKAKGMAETVSGLTPGIYIVVGQNKQGISKQKIVVTGR